MSKRPAVSILMAHRERLPLLRMTLESYRH